VEFLQEGLLVSLIMLLSLLQKVIPSLREKLDKQADEIKLLNQKLDDANSLLDDANSLKNQAIKERDMAKTSRDEAIISIDSAIKDRDKATNMWQKYKKRAEELESSMLKSEDMLKKVFPDIVGMLVKDDLEKESHSKPSRHGKSSKH